MKKPNRKSDFKFQAYDFFVKERIFFDFDYDVIWKFKILKNRLKWKHNFTGAWVDFPKIYSKELFQTYKAWEFNKDFRKFMEEL